MARTVGRAEKCRWTGPGADDLDRGSRGTRPEVRGLGQEQGTRPGAEAGLGQRGGGGTGPGNADGLDHKEQEDLSRAKRQTRSRISTEGWNNGRRRTGAREAKELGPGEQAD